MVECAQQTKAAVFRYGKGQIWDGVIESMDTSSGMMTFSVLHKGKRFGQFRSSMVGEHNLYNQVAITAALHFNGVSSEDIGAGFESFRGIRRRQEIVATVNEITIIDDFAHHPTAIDLTLQALRLRFGGRRIWGIFEPRSATSRRNTLQDQFAASFDHADIVVLAPPYDQSNIPAAERLDSNTLLHLIKSRGVEAFVGGKQPNGVVEWSRADIVDTIVEEVANHVIPGDVIAVMSNGGFGGIHQKLKNRISTLL